MQLWDSIWVGGHLVTLGGPEDGYGIVEDGALLNFEERAVSLWIKVGNRVMDASRATDVEVGAGHDVSDYRGTIGHVSTPKGLPAFERAVPVWFL